MQQHVALRHRLKAVAFAFRAGRGDLGGHWASEVLDELAAATAPAQVGDASAR